jgi:hypothetical protein
MVVPTDNAGATMQTMQSAHRIGDAKVSYQFVAESEMGREYQFEASASGRSAVTITSVRTRGPQFIR